MLAALVALPGSPASGGFLEDLFDFGGSRVAQPQSHGHEGWGRRGLHRYAFRSRHAHHMFYARHVAHSRVYAGQEEPDPAGPDAAARSVCVRTCDGFFFPAPNASGARRPRQATCASVCPDAESKLFVIPAGSGNIADAKAPEDGELYAQFMTRLATQDKPTSCSCHVLGDDMAQMKAVLNDPTLRPGDSVVTSEGVKVFRGGSAPYRKDAFLSLAQTPNLSPSKRGALAAIDRAIKTPIGRAFSLNERRRERHQRRVKASEQRSELPPEQQPGPEQP